MGPNLKGLTSQAKILSGTASKYSGLLEGGGWLPCDKKTSKPFWVSTFAGLDPITFFMRSALLLHSFAKFRFEFGHGIDLLDDLSIFVDQKSDWQGNDAELICKITLKSTVGVDLWPR